jgi:tetratricopeptide (TPR) repeat protein
MEQYTINKLERKINVLEDAVKTYYDQLKLALEYVTKDPQSSLTKSRIVLEKILNKIYEIEMKKEPKKLEIGYILNDNQFTRNIDRRILSRMNSVRDMANLGAHGEEVMPKDATRVLDDLCEVVEWYLKKYENIDITLRRKDDGINLQENVSQENLSERAKEWFNLNNEIMKYFYQENYDLAIEIAEKALKLAEEEFGKNHKIYALSLHNLGVVYLSLERCSESESLFKEALKIRKEQPEENDLDCTKTLNNLALLYLYKGEYEESESMLKESIKIIKEHPLKNQVDSEKSLYNYALLNLFQGKYADSESFLKEVMEMRKSRIGENHPDYTKILENLSLINELKKV